MKKIIIIDDDVIFRHLVKELLEDAGYVTDTAKNGLKDLKSLKRISMILSYLMSICLK